MHLLHVSTPGTPARSALSFRVQLIINNTPKHTRTPTTTILYSFSAEKTRKYYTIKLQNVDLCHPDTTLALACYRRTTSLFLMDKLCNSIAEVISSLGYQSFSPFLTQHMVLAGSHKASHRGTHPTLTYRYGCGELTPLLRFTVSFFTFCFREINCKIEGQTGRQKNQSTSNFTQFL